MGCEATGPHALAPAGGEDALQRNADVLFLQQKCANREIGWPTYKNAILQTAIANLEASTDNGNPSPNDTTAIKHNETGGPHGAGRHTEQRALPMPPHPQHAGQDVDKPRPKAGGTINPDLLVQNIGFTSQSNGIPEHTRRHATGTRPHGLPITSGPAAFRTLYIAPEDSSAPASNPPHPGEGGEYIVQPEQANTVTNSNEAETTLKSRKPAQKKHKTMDSLDIKQLNDNYGKLKRIFQAVTATGTFNHREARLRLPSGLNIAKWRELLAGYSDEGIVEFLEFGWPIGIDRHAILQSYDTNHASARAFPADVEHYVATELGHSALLGPFDGPPLPVCHFSPLMTKPKKDSIFRRVIIDLSWPKGQSVNDGISRTDYIDGPMTISLPTPDDMEMAVVRAGRGCFLYKTDLSRGYRQLRVDPLDWPYLTFRHGSHCFMDICPPFGLRSSAMAMQRASQAIVHLHGRRGYLSRAYIDDFGGAEGTEHRAAEALGTLQGIMNDLGIVQAEEKICHPSQVMVWLGIYFNTKEMYMAIPRDKLEEIMACLETWRGQSRATRKEMQSLLGLLNFVASVAPPTRLFTNRMLDSLRETTASGTTAVSWQFKQDVQFFVDLLPIFNGRRVMGKQLLPYQHQVELDACLSGCGAVAGDQFYAAQFPETVTSQGHSIAHLELLNITVAIKMWAGRWSGWTVQVYCDNMNSVCVLQSGRSADEFMRACAREIFLHTAANDVDIQICHRPGLSMIWADALSREHTHRKFANFVRDDPHLAAATRVTVPPDFFIISNKL